MLKNPSLACRLLPVFLFLTVSYVNGQPKITSFSPSGGPVGSSVTITGSGFGTTPAANTVYFGPVKAPVISASSSSLSVTVPAGTAYQSVSVLNNMSGLTAYSSGLYNTTYNNTIGTGFSPSFFKPRVDAVAPFGGYARDMVISDLDGDGKPDVIVSDDDRRTVAVLRNQSATGNLNSSAFAERVNYFVSFYVGRLVVKDLDGDGKPEIIISCGLPNNIIILYNRSTPGTINDSSFSKMIYIPTNSTGSSFDFSDLDGDGKPDLLVTDYMNSPVSVLRNVSTPGNLSTASFVQVAALTGYGNPAVKTGDMDGDGKPDLIFSYDDKVSVLRNISTPGNITAASFNPGFGYTFTSGETLQDMIVGDVDGDGKSDLLVSSTTYFTTPSDKVSILRNTSVPGNLNNSSFAPPVSLILKGSYHPFHAVALGDIDGDNKPDIVANNFDVNTFSVFRNISTPGAISTVSFEARADIGTRQGLRYLAISDIDTDGKPEIVIANLTSPLTITMHSVSQQLLPPTVTSVNPANAPAGATLTISGTNFNTMAAGNIVYFGAVKAGVTAASPTSLTVTVPAGATYQPVSVLNTASGLTAYSAQPFRPVFANPTGQGVSFSFYKPKIDFASTSAAGTYPYSFAAGDIDGDGRSDMAVVNANGNSVTVLRNTSATGNIDGASFTEQAVFATGINTLSVQIQDVDGDGRPDLIIANNTAGTISVLRNTAVAGSISAASFAPRVDFSTGEQIQPFAGSFPYAVALGDVNMDGRPDIVVANSRLNNVSVLLNASSPGSITATSFNKPIDYFVRPTPRAVAVGDVNGDGKPDIVVVDQAANLVSVMANKSVTTELYRINSSNSTFDIEYSFSTGNNPGSVAITDVDGDGKPDIVVGNVNSNTVSVLHNQIVDGIIGYESFGPKVDFPAGSQPFSITAGDVDGDGKPDLIVANAGSNTMSVLPNTATPGVINGSSFAPKADFATGVYPLSVAIADLDGDGIAEAATVNAATSSISVFRINSTQVAPVIFSLNPAIGAAGTPVTITGANFNPATSGNIVYFGAVKASVTSGTATSLSVTVPSGATYQPVSVLNTANALTGFSSKPFTLTFTNPFGSGVPAGFYLPKTDFPTGSLPFSVAVSDLDGDGKSDMLVANYNNNTVSVLRNTSVSGTVNTSSFASKTDFSCGLNPYSVLAGDVDGDGKPDIVVTNHSSSTVSVLRNTSVPGALNAASFSAPVNFAAGVFSYPYTTAIGDVNGDGRIDLVVANSLSASVAVRLNTSASGIISFAPPVNYAVGNFPRYVVLNDVDGDGKPEIITVNANDNTISVLRNTALSVLTGSSFATKVDFATGPDPYIVVMSDVDGDGKPDMAVANHGSANVSVMRNTSVAGQVNTSTFAARVDFACGAGPFSLAAADADGDGRPDLVTANAFDSTISVLRNTAAAGSITPASFTQKVDFVSGGYPLSITTGDIDGDGNTEVITSNGANTASVLKIASPTFTGVQAAGAEGLATEKAREANRIILYPNPSTGEFTIKLLHPKVTVASIEVFNEAGKSILKQPVNGNATSLSMKLNLTGQPAGVYYIKMTSVKGVQITKVVLQR